MEEIRKLREEAAICRELAREIRDPPSIAMFLERAADLEARARALEVRHAATASDQASPTQARPARLHPELENLQRH